MYADDCKLYKEINNELDAKLLQDDINCLVNWCHRWNLELNPKKCEKLTISNKKQPVNTTYLIDEDEILNVTTHVDLGVTFQNDFRFNAHIQTITNSCLKLVGFVKRNTHWTANIDLIRLLYVSLIRSKLTYASIIWFPKGNVYIEQIENVQKKIIKYICFKADVEFHRVDYQKLCTLLDLVPLEVITCRDALIFLNKLMSNDINSAALRSKITLRENNLHLFRNPEIFKVNMIHSDVTNRCIINITCKIANKIKVDHNILVTEMSYMQIKNMCTNDSILRGLKFF